MCVGTRMLIYYDDANMDVYSYSIDVPDGNWYRLN